MTLRTGSKRADMVREVFYVTAFLKLVNRIDDYSFVAITVGVVGGYLANRYLTYKKEDIDGQAKGV